VCRCSFFRRMSKPMAQGSAAGFERKQKARTCHPMQVLASASLAVRLARGQVEEERRDHNKRKEDDSCCPVQHQGLQVTALPASRSASPCVLRSRRVFLLSTKATGVPAMAASAGRAVAWRGNQR